MCVKVVGRNLIACPFTVADPEYLGLEVKTGDSESCLAGPLQRVPAP